MPHRHTVHAGVRELNRVTFKITKIKTKKQTNIKFRNAAILGASSCAIGNAFTLKGCRDGCGVCTCGETYPAGVAAGMLQRKRCHRQILHIKVLINVTHFNQNMQALNFLG